jgi:DNA-binding NtrC family response regulator
MIAEISRARIWLVEHQEFFRRQAAQTLTEGGFSVKTFSSYGTLLSRGDVEADAELVVVSCPSAGEEEQKLLRQLVERDVPVLFLMNFLTMDSMRQLFLEGATDVEEMPGSSKGLIAVAVKNIDRLNKKRQQPQAWVKAAL